MKEVGPIYGVELPLDSKPIGGGMTQAMPSRRDLENVARANIHGAMRVAAAYEVLVSDIQDLLKLLDDYRGALEMNRSTKRDLREQLKKANEAFDVLESATDQRIADLSKEVDLYREMYEREQQELHRANKDSELLDMLASQSAWLSWTSTVHEDGKGIKEIILKACRTEREGWDIRTMLRHHCGLE